MAHKTIVVFVVLMRQFVFGICFDVMAFWRVEFCSDMFNRMHRLEHNRKKHGCSGNEIEYGQMEFHNANVGLRRFL